MPNPKLGTVSNDISKAVKDIKTGLVEVRNDRMVIWHQQLEEKAILQINSWTITNISLKVLKRKTRQHER